MNPVQRMLCIMLVAILFFTAVFPLAPASEEGAGATASRDRVNWSNSSIGLPISGDYYGIALGDINKDGNADIAATNSGNWLRVYLGDGAGCWTAIAPQPPNGGGGDLRIGDIDGDGDMDIVTGSSSSTNGCHIFANNGATVFTEVTQTGLPTTGNWRGIALGDVNKDGRLDIAATNGYSGSNGLHVYTQNSTGKFADNSSGLPVTGERDSGVVLVDFSNDGNLDVACGGAAGSVICFLGNGGAGGTMTWTNSSTGLPAGRWTGINASDIDNDGSMDIVMSSYGAGQGLRAYRNVNNAASWTSWSTGLPTSNHYTDVTSADFDADGYVDIAAGRIAGNGLVVYYGNGTGTWAVNNTGLPQTISYCSIDAGDFSNDGGIDMVLASYTGTTPSYGLQAYRNNHAAVPLPQMTLLGPLGNASWSGGSWRQVSWNASNGTLPYSINISYSTDGGSTYPNIIATGIAQAVAGQNAQAWQLPSINSASVRVKVELRDATNRSVTRTSPNNFEIDSSAPAVLSTVPADGAQGASNSTSIMVRFGEAMNLSSAQGAVSISGLGAPALQSPVWSGDNLTFNTTGLLLGSRYNVTVSTLALDDSEPGNAMAAAYVFSFNTSVAPVPTISLTAPSGGELWFTGSQHNIQFMVGGGTGAKNVTLALSTAGPGGPWTAITSLLPPDGAQQYLWTVPASPSTNCYIRASATDSAVPPLSVNASNPVPFTIKDAAVPISVSVLSPNGGERWAAGTVQIITWNRTGGNGIVRINIECSRAGMSGPWTSVATGETDDGIYQWAVPDQPSANCFVRVSATDSYDPPQNATDTGNSAFTIAEAMKPLTVRVVSPNGGENWTVGTTQNITWNSTGGNGAVRYTVHYSVNGTGGPWTQIATILNGSTLCPWLVPPQPSVNCLFRVTASDEYAPPQNATDESDSAFTIYERPPPPPADGQPPSINFTSPAAGAAVNGTVAITVMASDNVGVMRIQLFIDGVSVANFTASQGTHTWVTTKKMEGSHVILARAYDAAGNAGNATLSVLVKFPTVTKPAEPGFMEKNGTVLIGLIVVIGVVCAVAALMMRRKPPQQAPAAAPPPAAQPYPQQAPPAAPYPPSGPPAQAPPSPPSSPGGYYPPAAPPQAPPPAPAPYAPPPSPGAPPALAAPPQPEPPSASPQPPPAQPPQ